MNSSILDQIAQSITPLLEVKTIGIENVIVKSSQAGDPYRILDPATGGEEGVVTDTKPSYITISTLGTLDIVSFTAWIKWRIAEMNIMEVQEAINKDPKNVLLQLTLITNQNISLARKNEFDKAQSQVEKELMQMRFDQLTLDFESKLQAFEDKQKVEWANEITKYINDNNQLQKEEISRAIAEFTSTNNRKIEELIQQTNKEVSNQFKLKLEEKRDKLFDQLNIRINQTEEQFA